MAAVARAAAPLINCILFACFACGCSFQHNPWAIDSISAGDPAFDSSRLRYGSLQAYPPFIFEFLKIEGEIASFLNLTHFQLTPSEEAKILFIIADQSFEEHPPVHEGGMRLRFSSEMTRRLIQALQAGQKIGIILNDLEETLEPSHFASSFETFAKKL